MSRKTDFWSSKTPDKIGPGYYSSEETQKTQQNKAAFLIKSKRQLSAPKPYNRFTPGPGAYDQAQDWVSNLSIQSSNFASKSKREVFQNLKPSTPGPGSYDTKLQNQSHIKKKPKFTALYLDPSPISIPSNEYSGKPVDTSPSQISSTKGTTFGKYRDVRKVFQNKTEVPGPGTYTIESQARAEASWMFQSSTGRPKVGLESGPGPGYYTLNEEDSSKNGYFTLAPKEANLTNDPYRPIQAGKIITPPVGSYKLSEELKQIEKLKAKYITGNIPVKHVPFNIHDKRKPPWVQKEDFPGPCDYSANRPKSTGPNFKSTQDRFAAMKIKEFPGPGYYDLEKIEKEKQVMVTRSPRFGKDDTKTPEPYLGHTEWNVKRTRALDFDMINQGVCFESSQVRFKDKIKNETLGPGCYESVRPSTVNPKIISKTGRFEGYGSYRPNTGTSHNLGPGCYNSITSEKKSFNLSKQTGKEIWL